VVEAECQFVSKSPEIARLHQELAIIYHVFTYLPIVLCHAAGRGQETRANTSAACVSTAWYIASGAFVVLIHPTDTPESSERSGDQNK
jgi:hypothetical protein